MIRFTLSFFIALFSANSFSFTLTPQDDGRVLIINDAGQRVGAFYKNRHRLLLSNFRKTVKVYDKSTGDLLKEFHEPESDDSASTTSSSSTSSKRKSDDAQTPSAKRSNVGYKTPPPSPDTPPEITPELLEQIRILESRAGLRASSSTTSTSIPPTVGGAAGAAGAPQNNESSYSSESEGESQINYLEGPEEHHAALLEAINKAQKNLIICSDTITFLDKDVYSALKNASQRGVNIDVFFRKGIDPRAEKFLDEIGQTYQSNLHAKFLVADNSYIVIGSHNWFDFNVIDYESFLSGNKSFKITGDTEQTSEIIEAISSRINDYIHPRLRAYTPPRTRKRYKMSDDSDYIQSGASYFSVLTSTKEHEDFLMEACKKAHKNLLIHSPFVTFYNAKKRIEKLAKIANPGVKIKLKAWDSPGFRQLVDFVKSNPRYEKIFTFYLMQEGDHSKMIMIDDMKLWSQGSFNWLSSSLSEQSRGHNLDATVVLEKHS